LAIRRGARDYNKANVPFPGRIEDLCGPLLFLDSANGTTDNPILKLYHKTVEDFFTQNSEDVKASPHLSKFFVTAEHVDVEIGLDCLTYLSYDRYKKPCDLDTLVRESPKEHAFLRYAANYWFQHLLLCDKPTAEVVQATTGFLKSKALWTCLGIQSRISPYLFGRYDGQARKGSYIMGLRGAEWVGDDSFGVPLPQWLLTHSEECKRLDVSFCCFENEWREVLVTRPDGLDACVPLKDIPQGCNLAPLTKQKAVRVAHLTDSFSMGDVASFLSFDVSVGKPLWANILYVPEDAKDKVRQIRVPLFSSKHKPSRAEYTLPIATDQKNWIDSIESDSKGQESPEAWSFSQQTMAVRRTTTTQTESFEMPLPYRKQSENMPGKYWETIMVEVPCSVKASSGIKIFQLIWRPRMGVAGDDTASDDGEQGSDDESVDAESTANEDSESESEMSNDDESDDDESNDDSSSSASEETDGDRDDDDTEQADDSSATTEDSHEVCSSNCLFILKSGKTPLWTDIWTEELCKWSNMVMAIHPTLPLLVYTRKALQLDVVDLETTKQSMVHLPELADLQETSACCTRGWFMRSVCATVDDG
jgi:hypothetical protein